jgi:hypothetical protein
MTISEREAKRRYELHVESIAARIEIFPYIPGVRRKWKGPSVCRWYSPPGVEHPKRIGA